MRYSTFVGGQNGATLAAAIALDPAGGAWITGWTYASDYPTTVRAHQRGLAGPNDAFLTLIDPSLERAARIVYSTFAGGQRVRLGDRSRHFPGWPDRFGRRYVILGLL